MQSPGTVTSHNAEATETDYYHFLKSFTVKPQTHFYESDSKDDTSICSMKNQVSMQSQPLFLKRNYRVMKQLRKERTPVI